MGIYIKGMEMPKSCDECFLPLQYCPYAMKPGGACPLVPVPPHGRLIDVDALLAGDGRYLVTLRKEAICVDEIYSAPTIIPPDPAEEGDV